MELKSPKGKKIVGTFEKLEGCANIESASIGKDGRIEIEYEGTTEIWWDNQKTVQKNGRPVFVDEDGELWTEKQVVAASKKGTA